MNPVIAAIDFSDSSATVLATARQEAAWREAPLIVTHVVQDLPVRDAYLVLSISPDELHQRLKEEAKTRLDGFLGEGPGEPLLLEGNPATALLELAEKREASLLVLGNHSHHLAHELTLGTVSLKVSLGTHCPLLLVRPDPGIKS